MDRGAWQAIYSPWGFNELDTSEQLTLLLFFKKRSINQEVAFAGQHTLSPLRMVRRHLLLPALSAAASLPSFLFATVRK